MSWAKTLVGQPNLAEYVDLRQRAFDAALAQEPIRLGNGGHP